MRKFTLAWECADGVSFVKLQRLFTPVILPDASSRMSRPQGPAKPFYFFVRGLAILLPPVLTLLILIWIGSALHDYVIRPINWALRYGIAQLKYANEIHPRESLLVPPPGLPSIPDWGRGYRIRPELEQELQSALGAIALQTPGGVSSEHLLELSRQHQVCVPIGKELVPTNYVPLDDYNLVFQHLRPTPPPTTAMGLYMEIAGVREFRTQWHLSLLAVSLSLLGLYFVGRFLSVRLGRWFWGRFEWMLTRVPLVSNVYATVKQLTDFVFTEREVEFNRVVAVEYPRAGAWSLGFLTGDGLGPCVDLAGEPLVSVLVPASPVPMSGFTVMVPRGSIIELDLTVDQALQYIVSCGVLLPPTMVPAESALGPRGLPGEVVSSPAATRPR
ncbi:MAG TPA: hypothetical protein DDY91_00675 [Planctomycetaceae bacterium]|nr:hypothetical protein [Planctomycetaceae bacterium]